MNPDGTGITPLTTNTYGNDGHLDISPDGKIIAYEGIRDSIYGWQVYAINADGTGLKRLTTPRESLGIPIGPRMGQRLSLFPTGVAIGIIFML